MSTNDTLRGLLADIKPILSGVAIYSASELNRDVAKSLLNRISAALAEPVSGEVPIVLVTPDNLESHRRSWVDALSRLVELEPVQYDPTEEDRRTYWQHELVAMRDMYADLDRLKALNGGAVAGRLTPGLEKAHDLLMEIDKIERVPTGYFRAIEAELKRERLSCATPAKVCDCRQGRDACTCKGGE